MKTSIALCTYNGEKFLRQQLESIEGQTRKPDELIACDDCSRDGTVEILEEFARMASFPVKIVRNEKNLGSLSNFEHAIRLCSGDLIALCDQDDVWKPHKLKLLVEHMHANIEAGYAFSDADLIDQHSKQLGYKLWESYGFLGKLKELYLQGEQFRCLARKNVVTGATMVFRASIGRLAMPFSVMNEAWVHDEWIAMVSTLSGHPGIAVDESLISYRIHPKQQIGAPGLSKGRSLLGMYRELKADSQSLYAIWEKQCLRILRLKEIQPRLQEKIKAQFPKKELDFLREFETHFRNRQRIMATPRAGRFGLILRETLSCRYARFSNSWRTIIRDILF